MFFNDYNGLESCHYLIEYVGERALVYWFWNKANLVKKLFSKRKCQDFCMVLQNNKLFQSIIFKWNLYKDSSTSVRIVSKLCLVSPYEICGQVMEEKLRARYKIIPIIYYSSGWECWTKSIFECCLLTQWMITLSRWTKNDLKIYSLILTNVWDIYNIILLWH